MRETKTLEDLGINPKPMTRGEVKELNKQGLNPLKKNKGEITPELNEKLEDWILKTVYPDVDFSLVPYQESVSLACRVVEMTFLGSQVEEKNLSASGSGIPREEPIIATPALKPSENPEI